MPRLFSGIEIPEQVALMLSFKAGGLEGARWIDRENYHITLRFVGDVDHRTASDVAQTLQQFEAMPAFTVTLDHLGVFGGTKPRALYAGEAPNAVLNRLQAAQERALQLLGLVPEGRKYTPHVTLARLRGTDAGAAARFLGQAAAFAPLSFPVNRFVLYSSRDSVGGGPYVIEDSYALSA